jgi:hypothetical protein
MLFIAQLPLPTAAILPAAAITKQDPIANLKSSMPIYTNWHRYGCNESAF